MCQQCANAAMTLLVAALAAAKDAKPEAREAYGYLEHAVASFQATAMSLDDTETSGRKLIEALRVIPTEELYAAGKTAHFMGGALAHLSNIVYAALEGRVQDGDEMAKEIMGDDSTGVERDERVVRVEVHVIDRETADAIVAAKKQAAGKAPPMMS